MRTEFPNVSEDVDLAATGDLAPLEVDLPRLLAGEMARADLADAVGALADVAQAVGVDVGADVGADDPNVSLDNQYQSPDWQRARGAEDGEFNLISD